MFDIISLIYSNGKRNLVNDKIWREKRYRFQVCLSTVLAANILKMFLDLFTFEVRKKQVMGKARIGCMRQPCDEWFNNSHHFLGVPFH